MHVVPPAEAKWATDSWVDRGSSRPYPSSSGALLQVSRGAMRLQQQSKESSRWYSSGGLVWFEDNVGQVLGRGIESRLVK